MSGGSFWRSFADLDEAAEPEALLRYLDDFGDLAPVAAAKRHSYTLLGLGPADHVLDVGCGTGDDVRALAGLVPAGRAVGVDASRAAVREARARAGAAGLGDRVAFAVNDACALPFGDGSFTAVRAERTLQHVGRPEVAVREMARVLQPGGTVVVTESTSALKPPEGTNAADTDRLLAGYAGERERHGHIRLFLPLVLRKAGFGDVTLHQATGQVVGAHVARRVFGIDADLDDRVTVEISTFHFTATRP